MDCSGTPAGSSAPAERRDDAAADRDDGADERDVSSARRDRTAESRDEHAEDRDAAARTHRSDLGDRLWDIRRQIVERLRRIEDTDIDPAAWQNLTPAALAQLRDHAAEQGRLAALDRAAVSSLIDEILTEVGPGHDEHRAAAADRTGSASDRTASAQDRIASAGDRDLAAVDRDQSAIERAQVDPPEVAASADPFAESHLDDWSEAVETSRQRIADSRETLARSHRTTGPGHGGP
ncbi:hypothetical protein ACQPZA_03355 [Pseudonocardia xinjiangensis]|uniref:hypothetical protein n=1 Tax=Pseudonocardia xinjiangensis TaxID=75289 RepID=UPI003D93A136